MRRELNLHLPQPSLEAGNKHKSAGGPWFGVGFWEMQIKIPPGLSSPHTHTEQLSQVASAPLEAKFKKTAF